MPWLFQYKNSEVWWVGYRLHGQQFLRSTGQRERDKALQELERVKAMVASQKAGALSHDLFQHLTGKAAPNVTLKHALDDWLNEAKGATGDRTVEKYTALSNELSDFFKANDRGPLMAEITQADLQRFLTERRSDVTAATGNMVRKCLAVFYRRSKLLGFIRDNPVDSIPMFKPGPEEKRIRRPFTRAEVATLYSKAPDDFWRYAVLGGFTTGLRLGDLVMMPVGAVDWKRRCLRLVVRKTSKTILVPMSPQFYTLLKKRKGKINGAAPGDPFWPEHAKRYEEQGSAWFSQRFHDLLLVPSGLVKRRPHRSGGKGKDSKRRLNEVSFHCLRHSCVSTHAANRANQQLVKALAGHESVELNDLYTTLPYEVLEKAVAELPDITR